MPETPLQMSGVRITHADAATPSPVSLDLEVAPGEVVLLLGPSGCGKSTAALTVNALVPQAIAAEVDGTVRTCGVEPSAHGVAAMSERVAMVFQDPDAQIVTGTVRDEVCFALENMLLPVDEIEDRADRALQAVGLADRADEVPDALSGGARQRLAIACALAMRCPLLVLDEPTANLDPAGSAEVYAVLHELVADRSCAVLLVEHDVDAALPITDRVVVLDHSGRTVHEGTPREVFTAHADRLVDLGVWLPTATALAHRLRGAGILSGPLPLHPDELGERLNAQELPPPPVRPSADTVQGDAEAGPLIRVRDLSVGPAEKPRLRHVDLDVHAGDFLAIVGANGAGKTTLVQAMTGVMRPPKRHVSIAGVDAATRDPRALARRVGFVFQNPEHQFVAHTVWDELAFGLRVHGDASGRRLRADEIEERVERILQRLGLGEHRDQHPFLLSGGQKRRLSVGTAIIVGAPILALDEPTFGQDRERADELMAMLDDLHRSGSTIVMVTHDMQLVAEHSTRTVIVSGGRIVGDQPTATLVADRREMSRHGLAVPSVARVTGLLADERWRGITRMRDLPEAAS